MALARVSVSMSAAIVLTLAASPATPAAAETGVYSLDPTTSAVDFTVFATKIFTFKRDGVFKAFTGQLSFDPNDLLNTQVDLTVYTSSVDIHNDEHNELLKSAGFFDVDHFPTMHFMSSLAEAKPDGTFAWTGDLTIRGITQRVTIPVRLTHKSDGSSGTNLESTFEIDRTAFGIIGTRQTQGFNVSISKKVRIHISMGTNGAAPG